MDSLALATREQMKQHAGLEDENGSFVFASVKAARAAVKAFGGELPDTTIEDRECRLRLHKTKIVAAVKQVPGEAKPAGWVEGKSKTWITVIHLETEAAQKLAAVNRIEERDEADKHLRFCCTRIEGLKNAEIWYIRDDAGEWVRVPANEIKPTLMADDLPQTYRGRAAKNTWELVNLPFQPAYPGERRWNKGAAQYMYKPVEGPCPHWDMVLAHCGRGLDAALLDHPWAMANGINRGSQYLMLWIARLLREPTHALPYLFLYSEEQDNGKSTLHEAISLLMTKGAASADRALTNANDFNGELANAVLAYIEEKDISQAKGAYGKLKDWVTSPVLWIRRMRTDLYPQVNTLHFIQTANEAGACPVFGDDTRITMIHVPRLREKDKIPPSVLMDRLREQGPAFMYRVMDLKLPPVYSRLGIPFIDTALKTQCVDQSVPNIVSGVVDLMADQTELEMTGSELAEAIGEDVDEWKHIARVRKVFEKHRRHIESRDIKFDFPPERTSRGKVVVLTNTANEKAVAA